MTVFNISVIHNRILGVIRQNLAFTIVSRFLDQVSEIIQLKARLTERKDLLKQVVGQ